MRYLNGVYTQSYNRRHGRDGPLMRGRFRTRLVQSERYLAELVRYIHANPVDAGLVDRARDYHWSSHRHYLDGQPPEWLETREVLARFGGSSPPLATTKSLRDYGGFWCLWGVAGWDAFSRRVALR